MIVSFEDRNPRRAATGHGAVHVVAAGAQREELLPVWNLDCRFVGRAVVNGCRAVIREEETLLDVACGGVVPGDARAPGKAIGELSVRVHPVNEIVGRQTVIVIAQVHGPAKLKLPQVVEAGGRLGLGLGSAQGG